MLGGSIRHLTNYLTFARVYLAGRFSVRRVGMSLFASIVAAPSALEAGTRPWCPYVF
jgi:hypothetical protein